MVFFLLLLLASPSLAHKVKVFAYGEGEKIVTKSYFGNGKAVMNSAITVQDSSDGKTLLYGETDEEGVFEFPVPRVAEQQRMDLKIILNTGEGHRAEWFLPADEYLESYGEERHAEVTADSADSADVDHEQMSHRSVIPEGISACNEQVVSRLIEQALDKKLAPLKEMMQQSRDSGPDFRDIIGGIGYIMGLAGIAAYMSSRKKNG